MQFPNGFSVPVLVQAPITSELPELPSLPPGREAYARNPFVGFTATLDKLEKLAHKLDKYSKHGLREAIAECRAAPPEKAPVHKIGQALGHVPDEAIPLWLTPWELAALTVSGDTPYHWKDMLNNIALPWIAEKIRLSAWHERYSKMDWPTLFATINALRSLKAPDGFSWHFDALRTFNHQGSARFHKCLDNRQTFIDADIAVFLHEGTTPRAVVSFNVVRMKNGTRCFFLRQVQMLEAKGNRWAFRFGSGSPFQNLAAVVLKAFRAQGFALRVVRGEVLIDGYLKGFKGALETWASKPGPEREELIHRTKKYKTEIRPRLAKVYAAPIPGFHKHGSDQTYYRLRQAA